MKKENYSVAVVGATGLVGSEILTALDERLFPLGALQLYASARSAGELVRCGDVSTRVELLDQADFGNTDIVLFAAGEQISAEWIDRATEGGATAIDTSPLFASDADVPLIVPEVNADAIADYTNRGLIVSPDASAIALATALKPLQSLGTITRVVASTYEPVSDAGRAGIDELQRQAIELMNGRAVEPELFAHRIAFNLLPQLGEFLAGGSSRGEQNTVHALRRLLNDPELAVSVTRVRVPLFYGSAVSLNVETAERITTSEAREILRAAPGILLQDEMTDNAYPTPMDVVGQDATFVGRVRDSEVANTLDLWIASDNIRKGSAVNAVQIAELLVRDYL